MLSVADVSQDVLPWSYVVKTPSQGPKDGRFVPSLPKRSSTKFTTSSGVLLSNKTRGWFQQPNGGNESISQREKGQSSTQKCRIGYVPRRLFEGEEIPCFKTVPWMHFKEKPLTPTPVLCLFVLQKHSQKKVSAQQRKKKNKGPSHFFPSHHHFHLFTLFTPSCQRPVVWSHTNRIEQWWHGRRNGSFRDRDLKGRLEESTGKRWNGMTIWG